MVTLVRAGTCPVERPPRPLLWRRARLIETFSRALFATLTHTRAGDDPREAPRPEAAGHARGTPALPTAPGAASGQSGGQGEFDAFFAHYQQPLYGYLRRLVPADDAATDLAQEAFFRAWQHFAEVRTYERPAAWLFRVATNLAISHLRRRLPASLSQTARALRHDPDSSNPAADDELLVDPGDFATASAERDLINALLSRLPEQQRAALLLRAVHGFTCDEIAQTLSISPVAARKTLSRGRERFRGLYLAAQREAQSGPAPRDIH